MSVTTEYDEHGKATRMAYFGASGEPVLHKDGYHGWIAEYDEHGKRIAGT